MTRLTGAALLILLTSCRENPRPAPPPAPVVLQVPPARGPLAIDGELDEPSWPSALHTPALADAGGREAPFSDVSFLADAQTLYLSVYVADADLRSKGDRVTVEVGPLTLVLGPDSAQVPPGVRVGTDIDGVIDDRSSDDEEWVSEIAIPRGLLPPGRIPFRIVRLDAGEGPRPHALAWPKASRALLELSAGSPAGAL